MMRVLFGSGVFKLLVRQHCFIYADRDEPIRTYVIGPNVSVVEKLKFFGKEYRTFLIILQRYEIIVVI